MSEHQISNDDPMLIILGRATESFPGLLCDVVRETTDGVLFDVINGAWRGTYKPTGEVLIHETGTVFPAKVWYHGLKSEASPTVLSTFRKEYL